MSTITANEAKVHFGETLLKAQREPVEITRNGKPVAVLVSVEDFQASEAIKQQYFTERLEKGKADIQAGRIVSGEAAFNKILNRKK